MPGALTVRVVERGAPVVLAATVTVNVAALLPDEGVTVTHEAEQAIVQAVLAVRVKECAPPDASNDSDEPGNDTDGVGVPPPPPVTVTVQVAV